MRVLALCLLASLAACKGAPPPPPPPPPILTLSIAGGADQNPDVAGQPNSVSIHLYQLTALARFERADVFGLLEKEKDMLGDDLAASETVLLSPGETLSLTRPLKPGVQALGVMVAFRDIDRAAWRVSAPVQPHGPTALTLRTAGIMARLAPVPAAAPGKTP